MNGLGGGVRVVFGDNYGAASPPMGPHRTPLVSSKICFFSFDFLQIEILGCEQGPVLNLWILGRVKELTPVSSQICLCNNMFSSTFQLMFIFSTNLN